MAAHFIIVGAGSAGAVLAARLTEDPDTHVVLIEAGPDYRSADAPAAVRAISPLPLLTSSDHGRFRYDDLAATRTEHQEPMMIWRGRGVGGSSSVNGMLAVRPEPDDLDDWAERGCTGWGWDDMLGWFNAIERDTNFGRLPWHGDRGPIPVWRPDPTGWGQLELAAKDAMLAHGHRWCDDHNRPGSTGVGPYAANISFRDDGTAERVSTNSAYLDEARDRPNLTIVGDALVDRVVLDTIDGAAAAVGVTYRHDGVEHAVEVKPRADGTAGEVLLCAGAPFSPAVMLRSGIGSSDLLDPVGVEVLHERAGVGRRVADHPGFGIQVVSSAEDVFGPSNGRHISCFARYSSEVGGGGLNDMAILAGANPALLPDGRRFGQMQVALWQPVSEGQLTLADAEPHSMPTITEQMLSHELDVERMRRGVRHLLDLARHESFAGLPGRRSFGRNATVFGSAGAPESIDDAAALADGELDELIAGHVYDTQHLVGGATMGDPDDPMTVVDPDCRVVGVDNLRVIDSSIFPTCPRANTNFTTIAIAERMAAALRA